MQKKIIRNLNIGKTNEEISKDLAISQEEIKIQLDKLQRLGVIIAQNQEAYLTA